MKKVFLLSVVYLTHLVLSAQPDPAQFEAFITEAANKFGLPSISVSVIRDGNVVLNTGTGIKSEAVSTKPDNSTLYAIASLSKAFTAASIGMLVDEGKLNWDDKVIEHLPWFEMHDPYVTNHMTIEDLLCHRSGLITFDCDLLWYGSNYNREDAIKQVKFRKPTHEFRTDFGYQNLMFMTAGEVIEAASGITWDEFVQTRILNPLGMKRTTSSFQAFSTDFNVAKPFLDGDEIFMLSYDNSGATAALNSSTGDMSKWLNFWLNQGVVNEDTLLSSESINRIWAMHTPLGVGRFDQQNGTHFKGYGLGWFLMDYNGKKVIHHGGGLPGYISKVALVPEEKLGIVVLTNDMSSVPTMLMYAVIDWAMGKDNQHWMTTFYDFKKQGEDREAKKKEERMDQQKKDPMSLPLEDYLGTYEDKMYGKATVSMGEDGLILSLIPTKELFTGNLTIWNDYAFKFAHNDPFLTYGVITFDVEKDVIKGFKIDLPNYDFHFDKLDFKKIE